MPPKLRMSYAVSTLIVSSVTTFLLPLDYTVASVALRDIHRDFSVSFSDQQWVINGYTMAFAALLMAGGGLADLFGRRKVFLSGLALFTAASLLAGLAPAMLWLNVGRVAQGIGAAGMFSSSLALLVQEFTGPRRIHAFAVFGVASGLGASLGPFIGGLAVDLGGWRWAFLLNAPFGIAMLILGLLRTRESKDRHATRLDLKVWCSSAERSCWRSTPSSWCRRSAGPVSPSSPRWPQRPCSPSPLSSWNCGRPTR